LPFNTQPMKRIRLLIVLLIGFNLFSLSAQNVDDRLQEIIQNRRLENLKDSVADGYVIQIYYGMSQSKATSSRASFTELFPDTVTKVFYKQPEWKVHVGNFTTKLEAERMLVAVRKEFASAFVKKASITL